MRALSNLRYLMRGPRHGRPDIDVSDQARNVDGEVMNELCEQLGIEKRRSSPYHSEGRGK